MLYGQHLHVNLTTSVNKLQTILRFSPFFPSFTFLFNLFCISSLCQSRFIEFPGPKVIKLFPCSTQLRMKFFLLINVRMPFMSIGILTFMSGKNSILGLSEPKKRTNFLIFLYLRAFKNFMLN